VTTELDVLLAAIYARPDDDDARMVYADALQGRSDPRGELIALQLGNTGAARVRALLEAHGRDWLGPLAAIVLTFSFERGFPARVAIDVGKHAKIRAVASHPSWATIHTVELGGGRSQQIGRPTALQKKAIQTLAKSAGFTRREFRPSLADILDSERRARAPRGRAPTRRAPARRSR